MPDFGVVSIPAIIVIAYFVGESVKAYKNVDNKKILPIVGLVGIILGITGFYVMPDYPAQDIITAAAIGAVSGMSSTWIDQFKKHVTN